MNLEKKKSLRVIKIKIPQLDTKHRTFSNTLINKRTKYVGRVCVRSCLCVCARARACVYAEAEMKSRMNYKII